MNRPHPPPALERQAWRLRGDVLIAAFPVVKIALCEIEPRQCSRAAALSVFVALLRSGKTLPPIQVIRQRNSFYPFRIFDGSHRSTAAWIAGLKVIPAQVVFSELERPGVRLIGKTETEIEKSLAPGKDGSAS